MVDKNSIIDYVSDTIDSHNELYYNEINKPIHDNPEIGYDEYKAHEILTTFLSKQDGWTVEKSACGMPTAFIATFEYKKPSLLATTTTTPTVVSYNAEYDALPGIGHACGHNLIATASVCAALSTAESMKHYQIPGVVKLFGTPAEEGGGGKIRFINAGEYDKVDVSMMCHGGNSYPGSSWGHTSANNTFICEFYGKAAHAAAAPWDGINALDAQVIYYNCVSVLRQQFKPGDLVHGNILQGGLSPNVIPNYTKNQITIRSKTRKGLGELKVKILNCIKAASIATGCTFKTTEVMSYYDMISNDPMCDLYRKYFNAFSLIDGDEQLFPKEKEHVFGENGASSDQGNVSYTIPSIQPMFAIDSPNGSNHNEHFTKAAGTRKSHDQALKAAKCMVLTALEILQSKKLLAEIKEAWEDDMKRNTPDDSVL